jgi:DNA-binding transcriptional regulator YiaG
MRQSNIADRGVMGERNRKPYHYTECGLDNVFLLNGFVIERMDGDDYVSVESIDNLWKSIGLDLVTHQKFFAPKELRFLRGLMDLTQLELASLLRVEDQTVARWEKGKVRLPGTADLAIRALFLASPVAQPEGDAVLAHWLTTVRGLAEMDAPGADTMVFARNAGGWAPQAMSLAA